LGIWFPKIPALGYIEIVPQRNAATLLPLINAHVAAGTIIHSDEWAAYNQVQRLSNVTTHEVVNHSVNFVANHWCTYTKCQELLEQSENKVEKNERMSW